MSEKLMKKEENINGIRGYKVVPSNWTCWQKQYTCPGVFEEDGRLEICVHGMHFCQQLIDCFRYYKLIPENHFLEVIAWGDTIISDHKCCTNKLEIVREIPWEEVLLLTNFGQSCIGVGNIGDHNYGNTNVGSNNQGDSNVGDINNGRCNTGAGNTGHYNTGDINTGCYNTGFKNFGDENVGDYNKGNHNVGNYNLGDSNIGDWNQSSNNFGCFNTPEREEPTMMFFNKPSDWTYQDWSMSLARRLLQNMPQPTVQWINTQNMTDEEKKTHPEYKKIDGYLKEWPPIITPQEWWERLNKQQQKAITSVPNFDAKIFKECTGIDVSVK